MTAPLFPMFLKIADKPCVVVGGGEIARGKVRSLTDCGARVRVVAPELHPELDDLQKSGTVEWTARAYRDGDLAGAFLAVVATDDEAVNAAARAEAEREGVLVNVVDRYALCDFIYPSVVRRGELTIAVSTGGRVPALSRYLREELELMIGPEYESLTRLLGEARDRLMAEKTLGYDERHTALRELLDGPLRGHLRAHRLDEAERLVRDFLKNREG